MRQTALFASIFLAGASAFAADSQLMNLVMPDAQVMAGVNVTTASISPLGVYIIARIGTAQNGNDAGLQSFINATGFDPRHDVSEILAASSGSAAAGKAPAPSGLLLAKGTFNVDKITAAIAAQKSQQVSTYAGALLVTSTDPKMAHAVAFIGTSIAVAGDVTSVKAALDRANGVNSVSPALATLVNSLSATEDAWSVSVASIGALIPGIGATSGQRAANQVGQLVKNIQSSSGGIKFGSNVDVTGQAVADTPQDAAALADMIRMVSALVSMGAAKDPQTAAAAQLLQSLQVTTAGNAVNISASIPESQIEAVLNTAAAQKSAAAAPGRRL
jgi:hypothetical protein